MFAVEPVVKPNVEVRAVNSALTSYYIRVTGGHLTELKKILYRTFLKSKLTNNYKQIIISYVTEPIMFVDMSYNDSSISWFELIHNTCKEIGFPEHLIFFSSGNLYASQCYNSWCRSNNVVNKICVQDLDKSYWLSRSITAGYNEMFDVTPDKHMTLFVGRPRYQKNYILKWYVENVLNSTLEDRVLSTFLYANVSSTDLWFIENEDKIKTLPGKVENQQRDHSYAWLNGSPQIFNKNFLRGLFDFTVDYIEHENILNIKDYQKFKKIHPWWKEDVFSEKLFKCILLKKPFIRLGMPHTLKILKEWGFKTFDGVLFDESYDSIENFHDRLNTILPQVNSYLEMPFDDLNKKVFSTEVQEIVEHNYNLAYEIYNSKKDAINV